MKWIHRIKEYIAKKDKDSIENKTNNFEIKQIDLLNIDHKVSVLEETLDNYYDIGISLYAIANNKKKNCLFIEAIEYLTMSKMYFRHICKSKIEKINLEIALIFIIIDYFDCSLGYLESLLCIKDYKRINTKKIIDIMILYILNFIIVSDTNPRLELKRLNELYRNEISEREHQKYTILYNIVSAYENRDTKHFLDSCNNLTDIEYYEEIMLLLRRIFDRLKRLKTS